jgi:hypothetical protein
VNKPALDAAAREAVSKKILMTVRAATERATDTAACASYTPICEGTFVTVNDGTCEAIRLAIGSAINAATDYRNVL